ncbi:hypothetical protein QL285_007434 [Trifolium repens]|nr:hypothetical protein QL285_007399 [Trifolium repens]KAK2448137.1 hypothetical protein QL285_007434 [Trifolium repens]
MALFKKLENGMHLNINFLERITIVTTLANLYDEKVDCFELGRGNSKFYLDFGLEYLFQITGLPLNGMQVSAFESEDTLQTILHHLTKNVKADSLLIRKKTPDVESDIIDVKNLLESFQNVPEDISELDLECLQPYVKAFLLFSLGTVIFLNDSGCRVHKSEERESR